jgi:hypothetical protein
MLGQCKHEARRTAAGDLRGDDTERNLSVCHCPSHAGMGGAERCPHGTRRRASAPHLDGHARMPAGLHRGLDGAPSVAPAPSVGWAARGLVVELLVPVSRPCNDGTVKQQNGDGAVKVR